MMTLSLASLSTTPCRRIGGVEVQLCAFLTLALDGSEWLASCPSSFTPGVKAPDTYWRGAWVGSKASLDTATKRKNPIIAPAWN